MRLSSRQAWMRMAKRTIGMALAWALVPMSVGATGIDRPYEDPEGCMQWVDTPLDDSCKWTVDVDQVQAAQPRAAAPADQCTLTKTQGDGFSVKSSFLICEGPDLEPQDRYCDVRVVPQDESPPVLTVGRPVVRFVGEEGWVDNWHSARRTCQFTWTDNCTSTNRVLKGIVEIVPDDPQEIITGQPGHFRSAGISADWFGFRLNLDLTDVGPRGYTLTYAAMDTSLNVTTEMCRIEVVEPVDPTCDGVDDDQDGQIDEDYVPLPTQCGVGACAADGLATCRNGRIVDTCAPGEPTAEICDTVDNDCDGDVDEALTRACATRCGEGARACVDGQWTDCNAPTPQPERCDGADNDCDGLTDEDFNLAQDPFHCGGCGIACEPGLEMCSEGACVTECLLRGEPHAIDQVRSNLLIVQDRSCSMRKPAIGGGSKWQAAVDAVVSLVTDFDDRLRLGLALFPDIEGGSCRQSDLAVALGRDTGDAIATLLSGALDVDDPLYPSGPCVTNIDTALRQATRHDPLFDGTRQSYVMLITDGKQSGSCSVGGGNSGSLEKLGELLDQGIPTYVVGFGDQVDAGWLTQFAQAGGVPREGQPSYYQADDPESLMDELQSIAADVAVCDLELESWPTLPDGTPDSAADVELFFRRSERVPRDVTRQEGWDVDLDAKTMTIYGTYCERLRHEVGMSPLLLGGCGY